MKKDTGCSWTELKNQVYPFSSRYSTKFQGIELNVVLSQLTLHLPDAGYFYLIPYSLSIERSTLYIVLFANVHGTSYCFNRIISFYQLNIHWPPSPLILVPSLIKVSRME